MSKFKDRVAVVTGAGSGIGRALALALADRGAKLALSDIDTESLAETVGLARARGAQVHAQQLDVGDKTAMNAYAATVLEHFSVVHQFYGNAGILLGSRQLLDMRENHIEKIVEVNLWGVIWGTRAFLPHLIASGEGVLVTMSSLNGLMGQPGLSIYCATKFAIRGFTEAVRCEMLKNGYPVQVTVVHPGGINTNIARAAIPDDADLSEEERVEAQERAKVYYRKFLKMPPEEAVEQILKGVERGRSRIVVTSGALFIDRLVRLFPQSYPKITTWLFARLLRDS